ncbi:MAG: PH domain-containing protein [Thermoprotei archaeon]
MGLTAIIMNFYVDALLISLWLLLVLLPLILTILEWRRTFYTLTDQRIIMAKGLVGRRVIALTYYRVGGVLDYSTYRVTGTQVSQGLFGRLLNYGTVIFMTNRGSLFWRAIKSPWDVRRFLEETTTTVQNEQYARNVGVEEAVRKATNIAIDQIYGYLPKSGPYLNQNQAQTMPPSNPSQLPPHNTQQSEASQFPQQNIQAIYCSQCGAKNEATANFCYKCGKQLYKQQS